MAEPTAMPQRQGPLDGRTLPAGDAVSLSVLPWRSMLNLRGDAGSSSFRAAVAAEIGVDLPRVANRMHEGAGRRLVWLGPDEWLVMAPDGEAAALETRLAGQIADDPRFAVVDLSHHYTGLLLEGPGRLHVLAKGCPLDLHPRRFGLGHCAQSLCAETRILICASASDSVELYARNSFARHLAAWLTDAMAELLDAGASD